MKKLLPLLLAFVLLMTGCAGEPEPQTPAVMEISKAGLTMTLTEEFTESEHINFTALYSTDKVMVMVLKEEFTRFENTDYSGESSLEEYAGLVWSANQQPGSPDLQSADGLVWFEHDSTVSGNDYHYRIYLFKGSDAFWLVQFGTFAHSFDSLADTIHGYAMTITVD